MTTFVVSVIARRRLPGVAVPAALELSNWSPYKISVSFCENTIYASTYNYFNQNLAQCGKKSPRRIEVLLLLFVFPDSPFI
jgi:hypothetical protein